MNKQDFLDKLRKKLSALPQDDIEERLNFYSEIIEDKIDEGLSEEDAVLEIGNVKEIASQIIAETPFTKLVKGKVKPKKQLKVWEIVLLILGSPIWLSLLIAVFAVIFSLYVSLWAVIISLWAVFVAVVACVPYCIFSCFVFAFNNSILSGFAMLGAGIVCIGLSMLLFCGCKSSTKATLLLSKKFALWIKNSFIKKEEVQ